MSEGKFDFKLFAAQFDKKFKDARVDLQKQPEKGAPGTFIPTASESLNFAIGIGGLPMGRVVEIYGPESSGKSTLALDMIKQAQTMFPNKPVGYIDVEQAVNREYAEAIGIDLSEERFVFTQEMETQTVLDMAHEMAKAGFSCVVVDSVASMIDKAKLEEGDSTDAKVGGNAKHMSTHLPFMVNATSNTGCLGIYLNQVREKIGVMFGNPETTSGGRGLPFYASVRVRTQIIEQLKYTDGSPKGARIRAKIVKNKVAAPYKTAEYELIFGKGIDGLADLRDLAIANGIIDKSGSWYTMGDVKLGQGKDAAREWLAQNPDKVKSIRDTLWSM